MNPMADTQLYSSILDSICVPEFIAHWRRSAQIVYVKHLFVLILKKEIYAINRTKVYQNECVFLTTIFFSFFKTSS